MLRKLFLGVAVTLSIASSLPAAPLFYISQAADAASASPGLLSVDGFKGSFNIIADSDVRLGGVSLNIVTTGGGIKFTGVTVPNPPTRWFALDGPQIVSDNKISNIGGAAIPGLSGEGIGGASPQGPKVVLATIGYQIAGSFANLHLEIGNNTVADWDGGFPTVFFGVPAGPGVPGGVPGGAGAAGAFVVLPEPATASLVFLSLLGLLIAPRRR